MAISYYVRSWILLIPLIPSILVTIFDLYHFISSRTLRTALNNHVIILLLSCVLIEQVTDIAWQSHYYRTGSALVFTAALCQAWVLIGTSMFVSVFLLMTWASIERHILIFHSTWFGTKSKRFFFHYLPLAVCILWPVAFYSVTLFILPCDIPYSSTRRYCGQFTCVLQKKWTSLLDSIGHYIAPAFVTVTFSMALFGRVLYYRYHVRQRIEWRNYKKMAGQLLPLSVLYTCLQLPPMTLYAAYSAGLSWSIAADYYTDSLFFTYLIVLFISFACALPIPDLGKKCRRCMLFWRWRGVVGSQARLITRPKVNPTARVAPIP